ncbi:MAG: hypothetical protein BAJATHORv1_30378 [Candidatus Thorarchaeota archaeon]|nr:MAG: hypothetical protein BAJATHORv1_30378 [Candidatus Thorarchaeota archaeon]
MPEFSFRQYCSVCGNKIQHTIKVAIAPEMTRAEVTCDKCQDHTNMLLTTCPDCLKAFQYFISDLDFVEEVQRLSGAYVRLIAGIRDSLKEVIEEFKVPVPKKWSVGLECTCGNEFTAEVPLPQLEDMKSGTS